MGARSGGGGGGRGGGGGLSAQTKSALAIANQQGVVSRYAESERKALIASMETKSPSMKQAYKKMAQNYGAKAKAAQAKLQQMKSDHLAQWPSK